MRIILDSSEIGSSDEIELKFIDSIGSFIDEDKEEMIAGIGGMPPFCEPASRVLIRCLMNPASRDFVTVDMRGLKAVLIALARERRVTVSVLVRDAVAQGLGLEAAYIDTAPNPTTVTDPSSDAVKLSIRLSNAEVHRLDAGARRAGLSRAAFLVGLIDGVPVLTSGGRAEQLRALLASNDEISALSRNINHLVRLLRESSVRAAQEYRDMLAALNDDVRAHLRLVSGVLAELRPAPVRSGPESRCPDAKEQ